MWNSILYGDVIRPDGTHLELNWGMYLICVLFALVVGVIVATVYRFSFKEAGRSMMIALMLVSPSVAAVVPLCNNNFGVGLMMAGVLGLVRFRSFPGTARDITAVFLTVICGILAGTGYISQTGILALVGCGVLLVMGRAKPAVKETEEWDLRIVIPESLNDGDVFGEILEKYTEEWKLIRIKTTNMGAMFELRYKIRMKKDASQREMLDDIRVRNGNMQVLCSLILPDEENML